MSRGAARWATASLAGAIPAFAVHVLVALGPGPSMLGRVTNGQFYEVQARSFLDGRWDVPAGSIGAERFRVGDRFYEYFGPFPALVRVPFVALGDGLDGRLSRLAVLTAVAVFLAGASLLAWNLRGDDPVRRRELVVAGAFVFVCGCATPLLFLTSWTAVYHEAIAWGSAWAVVAYGLLAAHLRRHATAPLVLAGVATAFSLDRLFPWFGFSAEPPILGGAVFEAVNPSASITSSSPVFVLLGIVGAGGALRARRRALAPIAVGAVAGCAGMLGLAFIDHRYLGDALPLLVVGAAAALPTIAASPLRRRTRILVAATVVFAAWSVWANTSLAYQYQHGWSMDATTSSRAEMVRTQLRVHDRLASRLPSRVTSSTGGEIPPPHSLAVSGDCTAVYWSDGREWHPVETTSATGHAVVDVDAVAAGAEAGAVELVRVEDRSGVSTVWLSAIRQVEYRWTPAGSTAPAERHVSGRALQGARVEVHLDRAGIFASRVSVTGQRGSLLDVEAPVAVGRVDARRAGVRLSDPSTPICKLLGRLGFDAEPSPR